MAPGVSGSSRNGVKGGDVSNLSKEAGGKNFGDGVWKYGGIHGD